MKLTFPPIKKAIISVGFGAIAFYINFHAINFSQFPQFKASILMGLLFPLIITMAWGWRYGLLSALAGGCQSMWWLWQSDGYGFLYAVPVFTLWIVWHGGWSDYRKRHKSTKWYHSMYAVEVPFRIFTELGFYTVFRWLVSLNPPPWAPEISWTHVTYSWVHFVAIKHIITAYILLLLCHVLLSLGPVRRFFGLDPKPEQKNTTYIISASILLGLCIWLIDDVVVYLAFYEGSGSFLEVITSKIAPRDLFIRNLFLLVCLISGLLISKLLSQRFKGERALQESEERYRSLVETLTDFVFILDPNGNATYLNPEFEKLTGYSDQKVIGNSFTEVLAPEYIESTVARFKRGLSGETIPVYEVELKHKDGKTVPVELKVTSLLDGDGKTIGRIGVGRDIRDRKRAEEALRESEEKYRSMMEAIIEPVYICSPDFRVEYMNPTMIRRTGRDATGENCSKALHDLDEKCSWCMHDKVQKGESFESEIVSPKDNRSYHVSESSIVHKDGSISKMTVFRDTTDLRTLETQLQQAQKMEAIGTLAGGVAHDLNNILGGLVSYPELLLLQLPEDSPLRKSILTIQKSGEKAAAVVQDLLTLARRGVVITEVVNLNDIISEYLKSPEHEKLQSYYSGVHLETHLDQNILNILGSPTHLSKTIMNLVSNAAEAMPEGGELSVSAENRYIDKPIRDYDHVKEGDYVVLTVSDTGMGISPDDIGKIFEPFYTKKKMGRSGTGLGMAVVWGTVKDHNGYIDVQSIEGKGTTFTLYFPVTRESLSKDDSHLAIESYSGNGERILIVDDVEEQRNIASGMLKELGYSVVSVSSGEEAVEYLKTNKADLLVLDMIMDPGMDGLETYKKILEIRSGQKAIIASGFSETDRVKEVQSLGAGVYIRKPLLLEKIGIAVKEELEK